MQCKLRDIQRRQAGIRKQQHEKLANYILTLGDEIYVEKMNFKALQKRSKKTEKNEKGKFKKKKRFGKSLANKAPAMFLEIINRKLNYYGKELIKINTVKVKASQYNHFEDNYSEKKLSQRWNYFSNGDKIQRDMYSAFLIMHVNDDLESINREACNKDYSNFKLLHDIEINRLKQTQQQNKLISSIGL